LTCIIFLTDIEPSLLATTVGFDDAIAKIAPVPGGRIASNLSTPNIPRLDKVKVPVEYSSGSNCFDLDLFTRSFHSLDNSNKSVLHGSLKTGVIRLIKELHKKKVRQFIVTSSSRKQVDLLVEYLFNGFNPFEFIISSEDVKLKKPNPLPYLKAIQLSGINKCNSIVFEDSNPGLKSSLAANLPTIFVPSNIPIVLDENIKLDCILDSLGDKNNVANVIKGPKLKKSYVDYGYLSDYLMTVSDAKN